MEKFARGAAEFTPRGRIYKVGCDLHRRGVGRGHRGPRPGTRAGSFPRPSTRGAGTSHLREPGHPPPPTASSPASGASPALLTRLSRHRHRGRLGQLVARRLRLLGVEVLGLGLLAPRHGVSIRGSRRVPPRVAYSTPPTPGVRKLPPPPGRSAHVPAILLLSRAGRFITSTDG